MTRRGARLVLIGNGNAEQAEAFRTEFSGDLDLVLDPELVGYRASKLENGLLTSMYPRTGFSFFRALRNGFRPGRIEGSGSQLGGAFVVTPDGQLIYRFVARSIDDRADLDEILAAIDRHDARIASAPPA